jgi:alpha-tubulin suppressor-like RCC1 family protein
VFGDNFYGNLGTGNSTRTSTIQQTVYSTSVWRSLSTVYGDSNFGIKNDGTLWGWGNNNSGQLGINSTVNASTPVQNTWGGTNWALVNSGYRNTAAIKTDGSLWIAGDNAFGQLGLPTTQYYSEFIPMGNHTYWKDVYIGRKTTFALEISGILYACGLNDKGQIGIGNTTNISSLTQVVVDKQWLAVASEYYTTAGIRIDGTLWLWGSNVSGQLGQNINPTILPAVSSPVQIFGGGTTWKQIAAGYSCFYALKTDGTLWSWGENGLGELGDNSTTNRSSPVQIAAPSNDWAYVGSGIRFAVALKKNGTLYSWGSNTESQLGNVGAVNFASNPLIVNTFGFTWKAISGGFSSTSLLTEQTPLTTPSPTNSPTPSPTPSGTEPTPSPTPSPTSSATVTPTPSPTTIGFLLYDWGPNDDGQIGVQNLGGNYNQPTLTNISTATWLKVFSGGRTTFGLSNQGLLYSWGSNLFGALGTVGYPLGSRATPALVSGSLGWLEITSGFQTVLATKVDGSLWAWGGNVAGVFGNDTADFDNHDSPILVSSTSYAKVVTNGNFTAGIRDDASLWLWGANDYGQLAQII